MIMLPSYSCFQTSHNHDHVSFLHTIHDCLDALFFFLLLLNIHYLKLIIRMFQAAVSMEHVCKHVSIHVPSVHFKGHNVDLETKFKLRFFLQYKYLLFHNTNQAALRGKLQNTVWGSKGGRVKYKQSETMWNCVVLLRWVCLFRHENGKSLFIQFV